MLEVVRKVNAYFKSATRAEVDNLLSQIILSERQSEVFDMYYIRKKEGDVYIDEEGYLKIQL